MLRRSSVVFILSAALFTLPAMASTTRHSVSTQSAHPHTAHKSTARIKTARTSTRSRARAVHVIHGQQAIEPERVSQIQAALIREHYMTGEPNGEWDATTQAAMQKYQADQGWQTRLMPDSRALLKLGLGPDYSSAINAKNSSFAAPAGNAIPSTEAAGFAAAAGVSQ